MLAFAAAASEAQAGATTGACLAKKRKAWGALRKCEAGAEAKQLQGRSSDAAKCRSRLDDALARISAQAAKTALSCRYGDNGDGTLTDYDTGLQWEQKIPGDGCLYDLRCWYSGFNWTLDQDYHAETQYLISALSGMRSLADPTLAGLAGHSDWRLPTIEELTGIADMAAPGCGAGSACIDAAFGATAAAEYWSITTLSTQDGQSFFVDFGDGSVSALGKLWDFKVRAVRRAL